MQDINLTAITTTTDEITAYYELLEGGLALASNPVDTNGDNLEEITDDLILFFNASEETAAAFEVENLVTEDGVVTVELFGDFYKEDGEGGYTDETIAVKVTIQAVEK